MGTASYSTLVPLNLAIFIGSKALLAMANLYNFFLFPKGSQQGQVSRARSHARFTHPNSASPATLTQSLDLNPSVIILLNMYQSLIQLLECSPTPTFIFSPYRIPICFTSVHS